MIIGPYKVRIYLIYTHKTYCFFQSIKGIRCPFKQKQMIFLNVCNTSKRIQIQNAKRNHLPMRFMSSRMRTFQDQSHKISKCFFSVETRKKNKKKNSSQNMKRSKKHVLPNFGSNNNFFQGKKQKGSNLFYIYHIF